MSKVITVPVSLYFTYSYYWSYYQVPDTTYARVPRTGTRYQGRLLIGCRIRKSSARQVSLPVGIQ